MLLSDVKDNYNSQVEWLGRGCKLDQGQIACQIQYTLPPQQTWDIFPNAGLLLGQRRRWWASSEPTLDERLMFNGEAAGNPITAGHDYIRFFSFFYDHFTCQILNML